MSKTLGAVTLVQKADLTLCLQLHHKPTSLAQFAFNG